MLEGIGDIYQNRAAKDDSRYMSEQDGWALKEEMIEAEWENFHQNFEEYGAEDEMQEMLKSFLKNCQGKEKDHAEFGRDFDRLAKAMVERLAMARFDERY